MVLSGALVEWEGSRDPILSRRWDAEQIAMLG